MMAESSSATDGSPRPLAFFLLVNGKPWTEVWDYVIAPGSDSPKNQMLWRWSFPKRPAVFLFVTGGESSAISRRKHFVSASRKFYCTAIMKKLILKNWRAKLISLLLATTLWYLIKKNVATTPLPSESTSSAAMTEKR